MKNIKFFKEGVLFAAVLAFVFCASVPNALSESAEESMLVKYLHEYGFTEPGAVLQNLNASADKTADLKEISVSFNEVFIDSGMAFTSAFVKPKNPEEVLVLPGDAEKESRVCGMYDEGFRTDKRSFEQAAGEDGKRLLAVYVYPKEFDKTGEYFIDHFQLEDDKSLLISGANIAEIGSNVKLNWQIQVYEVNLNTGAYDLIETQEYPVEMRPLASAE